MDAIKLMDELIKNDPILKKMIEEDDKWIAERKQLYLEKGLNKEDTNIKAWDDYWKMANDRDGVEFSIREIE